MKRQFNNVSDLDSAITEAVKQLGQDPMEYRGFWYMLYMHVFESLPNLIMLSSDGKYMNYGYCKDNDIDTKDTEKKYKTFPKIINTDLSLYNMVEKFKNNGIILRHNSEPVIITNDFIAYYNMYYDSICILDSQCMLRPEIKECIEMMKDKSNTFYYVTHSNMGFHTNTMDVKKIKIDLNLQYNDDLPHDKIMNFLKSDESGLIMLHGKPGGGKTSYIRYLISKCVNTKFMVMDNSVFNYITDASFISLLMDYKNCIIILEDCEEMLTKNRNNNVARLLNLTDGLLGDNFKIKFICTFNTDLKDLDEALQRKGRMKMRYEFKELCKEKVEILNEKMNLGLTDIGPMTLAELFNHTKNNGSTSKKKKSLGF